MTKRAFAATLISTVLTACGVAQHDASATKTSPVRRPTCTITINPAGAPQYAGTYDLYIDGIYAEDASLYFRPFYPQAAGGNSFSYDMRCAHLAGWPSYAMCQEEGFASDKFEVAYSGAASLGVRNANGGEVKLADMRCN